MNANATMPCPLKVTEIESNFRSLFETENRCRRADYEKCAPMPNLISINIRSDQPGRSDQMGVPSQRRAYEYQQRCAVKDNDWAEQRDFEECPDNRKGHPSPPSAAKTGEITEATRSRTMPHMSINDSVQNWKRIIKPVSGSPTGHYN